MYLYDYCYKLMQNNLNLLRKVGLYNVAGMKGANYRLFSWLANMTYKALDIDTMRSMESGDGEYIVSLTTYGTRINTVYITLDCIFRQSYRPGKVVLWLSKEEFPNGMKDLPKSLRDREHNISWFEIAFCEDLKSHKKYFYTMLYNPEKIAVTADDDVFYPSDWLKILHDAHIANPQMVCCINAHLMKTDLSGRIAQYDEWEHLTNESGPSLLLCPIGVGGVLYPPNSLHKDLFKKESIIVNCLNADDLWLKCMGLMNKSSVVRAGNYFYSFLSVKNAQIVSLSKKNVLGFQNDIQLKNILAEYGKKIGEVLK